MAKRRKTTKQQKQRTLVQRSEGVSTIHKPRGAVKYLVGLSCLLIAVSAGIFIHYGQTAEEKAELKYLRQNYSLQLKQIEQLANETVSLQTDMERLNALDAEIRQIVNNEDTTTTSRSGLVRPSIYYNNQAETQIQPTINDVSNAVNELQTAVKIREQSLVQMKQELLAKKARLAAIPSIWPTTGDVTSRFGWRWGGRDWHPGIDISNDIGTPVVATADGEVVQSGWNSGGYGNWVQIDHGNGISTIYGHNSQVIVHTGQIVKKGQVICYLGNTGYSTGPHVHYEIRVNGTAVDPGGFLNQ